MRDLDLIRESIPASDVPKQSEQIDAAQIDLQFRIDRNTARVCPEPFERFILVAIHAERSPVRSAYQRKPARDDAVEIAGVLPQRQETTLLSAGKAQSQLLDQLCAILRE